MLHNIKSMQYKVDLLLIRKECHHQSVRLTGVPSEVSVHAYLSSSVITSFNKSEKPIVCMTVETIQMLKTVKMLHEVHGKYQTKAT